MPFTVMAAANDGMAFAGLINESSLGSMTPVDKIIHLGGERSILWFYADLPKAADALESLSRMADLAELFGVDEAPDAQELARLVGQLRSLGQVTLVIHDLGSGRGGWKARHLQQSEAAKGTMEDSDQEGNHAENPLAIMLERGCVEWCSHPEELSSF